MDWMQNKGLHYFLRLACLVLAYAVTARFVLNYFAANHVVSIIWPPSGIALAALDDCARPSSGRVVPQFQPAAAVVIAGLGGQLVFQN